MVIQEDGVLNLIWMLFIRFLFTSLLILDQLKFALLKILLQWNFIIKILCYEKTSRTFSAKKGTVIYSLSQSRSSLKIQLNVIYFFSPYIHGLAKSDTTEQLSTAQCKCQPTEKGKACLSNMKIVLNSQTSPTAGSLDHSFRITALGYRVGVYLSHLEQRSSEEKKDKKVGECMLEGRCQAFFKSFQGFVLMWFFLKDRLELQCSRSPSCPGQGAKGDLCFLGLVYQELLMFRA